MRNSIRALVAMTVLYSVAALAENPHWTYDGDKGPDQWSKISLDYQVCKTGMNQSPINIDDLVDAELDEINSDYNGNSVEILNNGHTIQVNFSSGNSLVLDGQSFELKQFHFHTPSEHLIDDKSFPMEVHLVHKSLDGHLAVISSLFLTGKTNPTLDTILKNIPSEPGKAKPIGSMDLTYLLPDSKDYYRYNGSLTTPPCSEGVRWLVMKNTIEASEQQLKAFRKIMHSNNRPIQPKNARIILE